MGFKDILRKIADNNNENSWATNARIKRFAFFRDQIKDLPLPIRILDIGGTEEFWEMMGFTTSENIEIILLNLEETPVKYPNFSSIKGDGSNLSAFKDKSFDIVFSNSVIEHLYSWDNQEKMAKEAMRVGKFYFIQTPNYWFPIEPHFVFPGFQYLPKFLKEMLMRRFSLGHFPKITDEKEAKRLINEIKLLTKSELRDLFPDSSIYYDKFLGLNKSFVCHNFHTKEYQSYTRSISFEKNKIPLNRKLA
jgi:hypothetical protein